MRLAIVMIVVLSCTSSCLANADAEMYDRTNLWYGSESNFDEIWRGIMNSMSSPSNVVMEVRAFQATNKIPVLAEVIASNREYSVRMGLDTSILTWSEAEYRSLSTPPLPEEGEGRDRQNGRHLMALMGVPHGDEAIMCNNWVMPTNIFVGGKSYSVTTDLFECIHVVSPTNAQAEFASGRLDWCANGREARIHGFAQRVAGTSLGTVNHALNLSVINLDTATNMMFICSPPGPPCQRDVLIYKNMVLHMYASTNAASFAAEIINEGLPEGDRIPLLTAP